MSDLFDWSSPKTYILPVDMDDYLAMPAEMARDVEIKDGMIVHCESPSPNHNAIARNIERALLEGRAKRDSADPCLRVNRDIDMLVSEVPLHYKHPDAIVYRCIEQPRPKWRMKPTVADTVLVVEVVSPTTVTADLIDKRAEYARFGIQNYWIARMANEDGPALSIEMLTLNSAGEYVSAGHRSRGGSSAAIEAVVPFETYATWQDLDDGID
ncbi:Uma2 family endonuclease [Nocardia xishanensis]|uniref:Uma2 family endonuclease n=1 Tax=Nocardia xishanensis TaxID=238964 RepID=A0ABW7X8G2_9NOCA